MKRNDIMVFSLGWILGPIDLIIAGAALYLLIKHRSETSPKFRIVLDFISISIICAVFWGMIGGTAKDIGLIDPQTASLISLLLSTLYLIFTFLAVWYCTHNLDGHKIKKKKR